MSYTYSKTSDFSGTLDAYQLQTEIIAESSITPAIQSVNIDGDVVTIIFASALSESEQTTLATVISNHVVAARYRRSMNIPIAMVATTSTIYNAVKIFEYGGSIRMPLVNLKVISEMDEGGTSYDVRICDVPNNTVICSANFTNESLAINNMGTISNLPLTETIFEVHIKVNGTTNAIIHEVILDHN